MTEAEPRLVDTGRGQTITYRGKTLYSPRDPQGAAIRRVEKLSQAPNTLVFIPSLGLGYGLAELLARLPESCHVLCIEADECLFRWALDRAPSLPQSERLTIIRTSQPERAAAVLHDLGAWRFRRVVPLHLCGGYQLARRTYRRLQEALEEEIRLYWQNKLTLVAMSHLWLRNVFTNLRLLPGSGDIRELATDRPVLVTGAGPSLEASLEWIGRIRGHVILLAVDTSLPVLAAAGLPPDWVFTLDAQVFTLGDFLPFRDPRIKLLCDLTSNPQSLRLFAELYFFSTRFHPLVLFDRLESASVLPTGLPPRGSVGVSSVEAALAVTTGPVLFTGLDFSYPGRQTHARGAPFHLAMLAHCNRRRPCGMRAFESLLTRPKLRLQGKRGDSVLTDMVLYTYARQLQSINAGCPRSFDLGVEGLPVGARTIESFDELDALCRPGRAAGGSRPCSSPEPAPARRNRGAGVREILRFCEQERSLLSEVLRTIAGAAPDLSRAIAPVDYLLLSLPETNPARMLTEANRARIEKQAKLLSRYLQRSCDALARSEC
jgi:hypothetical protein